MPPRLVIAEKPFVIFSIPGKDGNSLVSGWPDNLLRLSHKMYFTRRRRVAKKTKFDNQLFKAAVFASLRETIFYPSFIRQPTWVESFDSEFEDLKMLVNCSQLFVLSDSQLSNYPVIQ